MTVAEMGHPWQASEEKRIDEEEVV
jgi:hypothetical protein